MSLITNHMLQAGQSASLIGPFNSIHVTRRRSRLAATFTLLAASVTAPSLISAPHSHLTAINSPYLNRGQAFAARHDRARAIADFTQAIRIQSDGGPAYPQRRFLPQA